MQSNPSLDELEADTHSVHFHVNLLTLFRPLVQSVETFQLRSLASVDGNPSTILQASINQLKQTIFWIFSRHGRSASRYLTIGLLSLSDAVLKEEGDPYRRLYCLLCVRACRYMYVSYPVLAEVAKAFLATAIQNGVVSGAEAAGLMDDIKQQGRHHDGNADVLASFFSDLNMASTDPKRASVQAAAQRFEDLVLFDEFVTRDLVASPKGEEKP